MTDYENTLPAKSGIIDERNLIKDFIPKCKCSNDAEENHTCPFQVDINNDTEFTCNCCDECQEQCAMDV